ncbi:vWA domain-containing protein, partial [Salmonella sp. s54836]|uniref:vWA domain-containing protein n=1 Tax=Salmonella sp. s54836 TaxID=3159673 RepID=UPI003980D1A2
STKVGRDYVEFNFEFFKDVNNLEICFKKVGKESCISNNIIMSKSLGDFSSGEKYSFSYAVTASTDYTFEVSSDAGSSSGTVTTAAEVCAQKVSLHFIIDASGSLGQDGFNEEREFVVNLLKRFQDGPDLFSYQLFSEFVYALSNFTDQAEFITSLANERYAASQTNLQHPLTVTYAMYFTPENKDPDATKVVVFLTDGIHTTGDSSMIPELSNNIYFNSGAAFIAIGFG